MPIGHVLLKVAEADHRATVDFYTRVLETLGIGKLQVMPNGWVAFGDKAPEWIVGTAPVNSEIKAHVAFVASDRSSVDAFHAAAVTVGGQDNGSPGPRPQIHPNYYGAFVLDPQGNNIEAFYIGPIA